MKLTVDQLKVGDKLRFPNGDVWEANKRVNDNTWAVDACGNERWLTLKQLASILSAVEVERKPEKVTFSVEIRRCGGRYCDGWEALNDFDGHTVNVTVEVAS